MNAAGFGCWCEDEPSSHGTRSRHSARGGFSGPFCYDTVSRDRRGAPVSSDREGPSLSAEEEADHRPSTQMATLSDKIKFEVNTAQNRWEITYHSLFRLLLGQCCGLLPSFLRRLFVLLLLFLGPFVN